MQMMHRVEAQGTKHLDGLPAAISALAIHQNGARTVPTTQLLLEGRIWGAREAYEKGLVNRIVPDANVVDEGYATARRIADGAPLVARWHKKFVRRLLEPRPLTQEERDEGYACFDTEDFKTGVAAFLAKKKPEFRGR